MIADDVGGDWFEFEGTVGSKLVTELVDVMNIGSDENGNLVDVSTD